jgi:hypothetical protein
MSVARWRECLAPSGRSAIQRSRQVGRHPSLLSPPSYRRRLLESPRPTTPPHCTITRQRQNEQVGESICQLIIAFWGSEMIFQASNCFVGASLMACTASFGVFVYVLINVVLILHVRFLLDRPKLRQKGLGEVKDECLYRFNKIFISHLFCI